MTDISVVIVNYNTQEHLGKCIESIFSSTWGLSLQVIVVDNNSPDRAIEDFPANFDNVKFLFLNENKGFGYGCNRGVEAADGKYILLLNPDIVVTDGSINRMFDYAENHPEASCFTGLLTNDNDELSYCFNYFPDFSWEMKEAFGVGAESFVKKLLLRDEIKNNIPFEIDWAHGACIMIRKVVFDEINGFDENIFLYYEDVDIQKRIKELGYKNICLPSSRFYHYERSSIKSINSYRTYYFYMHKSKKYYLNKYFPLYQRVIIINAYILAYISKIIMLPFRKKYNRHIREKLKHYFLILGVYTNIVRHV